MTQPIKQTANKTREQVQTLKRLIGRLLSSQWLQFSNHFHYQYSIICKRIQYLCGVNDHKNRAFAFSEWRKTPSRTSLSKKLCICIWNNSLFYQQSEHRPRLSAVIKTPKLLKFQVFEIIETLDSIIRHGISKKVADIRYHLRKVSKECFVFKKRAFALWSFSMFDSHLSKGYWAC